jgi:hypothetical protein
MNDCFEAATPFPKAGYQQLELGEQLNFALGSPA